ncbi:hypothetical protein AB6A40_007617 [Gnathostoma spinigerum]|uniref:Uncharacterized protein n=1 Tax=Gnathostoma spinigerum TaxID=75299 RepID=A0ABD6EV30_9BILA
MARRTLRRAGVHILNGMGDGQPEAQRRAWDQTEFYDIASNIDPRRDLWIRSPINPRSIFSEHLRHYSRPAQLHSGNSTDQTTFPVFSSVHPFEHRNHPTASVAASRTGDTRPHSDIPARRNRFERQLQRIRITQSTHRPLERIEQNPHPQLLSPVAHNTRSSVDSPLPLSTSSSCRTTCGDTDSWSSSESTEGNLATATAIVSE